MLIYGKLNSLRKKLRFHLSLLAFLLLSTFLLSLLQPNFNNSLISNNKEAIEVKTASGDDILFNGNEASLNITDYGNLYKYNQEVSVDNQENVNLTYYLDDIHDWKASQINISVNNLYDTRNWVNNSGFKSPTIYRVYQVSQTNHPYTQPHNPSSVVDTIVGSNNPTYMRAHFAEIGFERYYDYLYIWNGSDQYHLITDTDSRYNVYSPWIPGNTIKLTYRADNKDPYYGYYMDYYEYVNDSSNYEINSDTWGFNYAENGISGTNIYGVGECGNTTAMYVGLYGNRLDYFDFDYTEGAFSELYQNITIPRGSVINAYISFDYNVPFGLESNDNYIYFKINNKKVFSKGMGDIIEAGKNKWYNTGKIYMDLWTNTSSIFEGILSEQNFNISVGIMSGSSVELTYFEEAFQNIVWFDNVSLVVTATANSTQSDIDLQVNGLSLNDTEWGKSNKELINEWDSNPISLNFTTESPSLTFMLDTMINGYHETHSKLGQSINEGIFYEILENGTILWEFSHNFYMPTQYSDFVFTINKPISWNFISVLDPTLQHRTYEYGNEGDLILHINKENAIFPGWWTFRATSDNYLSLINTKLLKNGGLTESIFNTGESIIIKTQVNHSDEIPTNLDATSVNLTIYDPEGLEWFYEAKTPLSNGTVFFSELYFDALNTTGGQFNYTLFWSNGTSLGGLNSSFLVVHESAFSLLKPNDAISDLITDAFVGDLIPVRIKLIDSENNNSISNAIISYNWSSGNAFFEEAALGIYETILDTSDLGSNGIYEILIESNKLGFFDYNLTLNINLGEETSLQRLQSDYNIELHANSTIKFRYYSLLDGEGIDGANLVVNITNPDLYYITNSLGGYYEIEFNTSFTNELGVFQLNFNFAATAYEPQTHIYQFEIIAQSIEILSYINNIEISQNSIIDVTYTEEINISARSRASIDNNLLTGGNFTWMINSYQQSLDEFANYWYNSTIQVNPSVYSLGLNLISIKFEMENYQTEIFYFQLLVYEQAIDLSLYLDSNQISENQLVEVMFKQNITLSVRAYGLVDLNYINSASISWNSDNYLMNFIEYGANWYNLSILISALNFSSGINTVSIKFEKQYYITTYFSFQLLVKEQTVQINASINNEPILENALIEVMVKENVTIAAQAYAMGEGVYLSGGNITLIVNYFNFTLTEEISNPTWFATSIVIDGAYFDLGINSVSIKFKQDNYTEAYFSFMFLITAETVNLSLYLNSDEIFQNNLINVTYYDEFTLSLRALANAEKIFLEGGSAIFLIGTYSQDITENINFWYNTSVICDPSNFNLGINTVKIQFDHPNYTLATFYFLILVNQIEMNAETIDFQDSIEGTSGDYMIFRINLTELSSTNFIEYATISYSWEFGLGNFEYIGNGIYEAELYIPENIQGSYRVSIIISSDNILYQAKQTSFIVVVSAKELPNFILWIVLIGLALIISVLGSLSIRSYVIIPRKRRKEAMLLSRTQRFRDLQNIQAIVIMHRFSGIPLFAKSYTILEKQKRELFSGFIQAITTIGEEIVGKKTTTEAPVDVDDSDKTRTILELDFKYFYCLICDRQELRLVLILRDRASERLKKQISDLSLGLMLQLGEKIEKWDGSLDQFDELMPPIISKYIELAFKDLFILNSPAFIADVKKEVELSTMEKRVLNVIYSMAKSKSEFYLENILNIVHENNKSLVIDAIEGLVNKKIIILNKV